MSLHVLDEAIRCLGCEKPLCQQGCPIPVSYTHLDVYKRQRRPCAASR